MNMKIDGTAVVPIGWVMGGFTATIAFTVAIAFWVATVNFRLQRIEQKLGIPPVQSTKLEVIPNSFAEQK